MERDTLEVVVRHVARVAEVANKMDVDNLALLFGQVLLWPDPNIPVDLSLITGDLRGEYKKINEPNFQKQQKTCRSQMLLSGSTKRYFPNDRIHCDFN